MRLLAAAVAGLIGSAAAGLSEAMPQLEFRTPSEQFFIGFRDLAGVAPEPQGHLSYQMDRDARAAFAAFTARNVGAELRIHVCGVQVSRVIVQAQVDSGVFFHPVGDAAQAAAILAMVAEETECPPDE